MNNVTTVSSGYFYKSGNRQQEWKSKIDLKQDASSDYDYSDAFSNNPMMVSEGWFRTAAGALINQNFAKTWVQPNTFLPSSIPTDFWVTSTDDLALKRFKNKLANGSAQFKALVPLGEFRETMGLARTANKTISDLLKLLVGLKRRNVREAAKIASDAWLQFSFAISPTISEMKNLMESLTEYHLSDEPRTINLKGGALTEWQTQVLSTQTAEACKGYYWYSDRARLEHTYTCVYTGGAKIALKNANDYSQSQHLGVTFGDIIPAAWELTPYSWLVDYFTTMGDYLEDTWTSDPGKLYYTCVSKTYRAKSVRVWTLKKDPNVTGNYVTTNVKGPYITVSERIIHQRRKLSALPHRALRFKGVDEVAANGVRRLLNLTSLLIGRSHAEYHETQRQLRDSTKKGGLAKRKRISRLRSRYRPY